MIPVLEPDSAKVEDDVVAMLGNYHGRMLVIRSKEGVVRGMGDDEFFHRFQTVCEVRYEVCKIAANISTSWSGVSRLPTGQERLIELVIMFGRLQKGHLHDKWLAFNLHFSLSFDIHSCSTQLPIYVWHA